MKLNHQKSQTESSLAKWKAEAEYAVAKLGKVSYHTFDKIIQTLKDFEFEVNRLMALHNETITEMNHDHETELMKTQVDF